MRKTILFLALLIPPLLGAQEIRRPSVSSPTSVPNAYDASGESTFADFDTSGSACDSTFDEAFGRWTCTDTGASSDITTDLSGWGAASGAYSALTLKVKSDCSVSFGDGASGFCQIQYSTNSGVSWTSFGVGSSWAGVTNTATLSPTQDLTALRVRLEVEADGSSGGPYFESPQPASSFLTIYDVRTEGTLIPPPAAPTGLSATPATDGATVSLAWTDNASNETSYKVQRCSGVSCVPADFATGLAANSTSYLNNTSVTTNTRYGYAVCAVNANGATCSSTVYTDTLPAPTGFSGTPGATTLTVTLNWTDNATIETSYKMQKCTGSGCAPVDYVTGLAVNTASYLDNSGLSPATTYRYAACAVSSIVTACSAPVTVTTTSTPSAPTALNLSVFSNSRIDLTWADNSAFEDSYAVERCTGTGCSTFSQIATLPANTTSYTDSTLAASTTYRYRVRAFFGTTPSGYSNEAEGTTNAAVKKPIIVVVVE